MRLTLRFRRSLVLPLTLIGCWTAWVVASNTVWIFKQPEKASYILRYACVDGTLGLAVCALMYVIYSRVRDRLALVPLLLLAALLCYAAAVGWHAASALTRWSLKMNDQLSLEPESLFIGGGLADGITLAFFSLLFFAVDHWRQLRDQRQRAREATALATQAQLQMLRYQLNPHFLFNALNSIRAMILGEPERARQIVTELAEFLRYSLHGRGHESALSEEMQAIENYLAIQRIRFEDKLVVTMRVDPAVRDVVLPCFLVHPLVENAVKYGMETSDPPLRLEIDVTPRGRDLVIRVANTGHLLPAAADGGESPNGTGTGLKNVAQRLELAYPGRHAFTVREEAGWVRAEIVLQPAGPGEAA